MRSLVAVALVSLLAVACHSPFGKAPPETGENAGRVGRGIHGWPIVEHAPHGDGWRTDIVWPGFSQIRTDGDGLNQTDVLFPIFHVATEGKRKRTGLLRPLFDLETVGDEEWDLDIAWPIFKWRDSDDKWERRVAPLYRATGNAAGTESELDLLWPLYREAESERWSESHLFPVFWDRSHKVDDEGYRHVWPFYGREWDNTWERNWYGLPLFARTTDPENDVSETDLLFPLIHWGHDGNETHTRLLPLLWFDESPREERTIVFPAWWDFRQDHSQFRMLFPIYGRYTHRDQDETVSIGGPLYIAGNDGDEEFTWLAAPIVHWRSSPDEWGGHLFPVFWIEREEDGDGHTNLWPLFGWEKSGKKTTASIATPFLAYNWKEDWWSLDLPWPFVAFAGSDNHSESMVWPLFDHERKGESSKGNLLWFVSTWERESEDDRDFRILWRLVENSRQNGKDTLVVNPLFRHETNDQGDTYWSFLFGLIARKQEAGATDWRWLWVF